VRWTFCGAKYFPKAILHVQEKKMVLQKQANSTPFGSPAFYQGACFNSSVTLLLLGLVKSGLAQNNVAAKLIKSWVLMCEIGPGCGSQNKQ